MTSLNREYSYFSRMMFWMTIGCGLLAFIMWSLNIWLVTTFTVLTLIYLGMLVFLLRKV